jgi:hypothetical protein
LSWQNPFEQFKFSFLQITPQFTGGEKHSEERTTLFDVRVKLPCYIFVLAPIRNQATCSFHSFALLYEGWSDRWIIELHHAAYLQSDIYTRVTCSETNLPFYMDVKQQHLQLDQSHNFHLKMKVGHAP